MAEAQHYPHGTRKLDTLSDILTRETDPSKIIDEVLLKVNKNLGAKHTFLAEVIGNKATVVFSAADKNTAPIVPGYEYDIRRSPCPTIHTSHTYVYGDTTRDVPPANNKLMEDLGGVCYLGTQLPLGVGNRQLILVSIREKPPTERIVDGYLQLSGIVSTVLVDQYLKANGINDADRVPLIILSLRHALAVRDIETVRHSEVVGDLAMRIALQAGAPPAIAQSIKIQAELHDVGKLLIPLSILKKPDVLTDEEYELMKRHAKYSMKILSLFPSLRQFILGPYLHHRKYDGSGYPEILDPTIVHPDLPLIGQNIPLVVRALTIADVITALTEPRVYRDQGERLLTFAEVRDIILHGAGKDFDPFLVELALSILDSEVSHGNKQTYWTYIAQKLREHKRPRLIITSVAE